MASFGMEPHSGFSGGLICTILYSIWPPAYSAVHLAQDSQELIKPRIALSMAYQTSDMYPV